MKADNFKKLENAHDSEGEKRFKKLWDKANIGWVTTEDSITSKVYGFGFFCSVLKNGKIKHYQQEKGI